MIAPDAVPGPVLVIPQHRAKTGASGPAVASLVVAFDQGGGGALHPMMSRRHRIAAALLLLIAFSGDAAVVGQVGSSAGTATGTQTQSTSGSVALVQDATSGTIYRTGALAAAAGKVIPAAAIFADGFESGSTP